MLSAHKPTPDYYVSDYHSTIISVGKLYDACEDEAGASVYDTPHRRTIGPKDPPESGDVDTKVRYEGSVKVSDLENVAKHTPNRDTSYLPDEDVRALNIISWARINDKAWTGGRVGKRFYLADGDVGLFKKRNNFEIGEQTVYQVRSGFFSSIHRGSVT
jgi:hypothetical protein